MWEISMNQQWPSLWLLFQVSNTNSELHIVVGATSNSPPTYTFIDPRLMTRADSCIHTKPTAFPSSLFILTFAWGNNMENWPPLVYRKLLQNQISHFQPKWTLQQFLQDNCLDSCEPPFGTNTMPACYRHTCLIHMAAKTCTVASQTLASSVILSRQCVSLWPLAGCVHSDLQLSCLSVPVWDMMPDFSHHKNQTCKTLEQQLTHTSL